MSFQQRIQAALSHPTLGGALNTNYNRMLAGRTRAMGALPLAEQARDQARAIRLKTLAHLDQYLLRFEAQVTARGGQVHWAADAAEAREIVLGLVRQAGTRLVAKAKSMVTEELGLNAALQAEGISVVETDLGEYILQLRGDHPSHIVAPAIHLTEADFAGVLARQAAPAAEGNGPAWDVRRMTDTVRARLREVFLTAGVGISGVNFGVAETGSLCLVTNEGNGRMVTSLPPVHIAVMGLERLVPTLADLEIMLRVLARSATAQKLTAYTSLLTGPRRPGEDDGPEALHVVIVDNGRSRVLGGELAESLLCIRCGACLNICPVYREIGGHAYSDVYSGPIGAIVLPALGGVDHFGELAQASSLCGACQEVCPVRIDIPTLLLKTRALHQAATGGDRRWNALMRLWAWGMSGPRRFGLGLRLARLGQRILGAVGAADRLPPPLSGWTDERSAPQLAPQSFRERWQRRLVQGQPEAGQPTKGQAHG